MRIALISTYTHPVALGLRYISAMLRLAGHETQIFLMQSRRDTTRPDWSDAALEDLAERLRLFDLVGLSLMTNTFHRAHFLTQRLRQAGIRAPIVWGGTHPTVAPEECLEIADAICVGEGEQPMRELVSRLAEGRDPTDIAGLSFRAAGPFGNARSVRNPPAPLADNLDKHPFPDWDLSHQFVPGRDGLVPATPDNLRGALDTLRVQTSRGCPFRCTFCNNAALQEIYRGRGRWVRLRSIDNVLAEIQQLRARFPTIRAVNFVDDLFLVRSTEELEEFAGRYNREVGLPLQLDAFPNTVTESKVRILSRMPIQLVSMGIESASSATLRDIYRRPTPPTRIAEAIALFAKYRIPVEYHYIVSNPYEPESNVIETMRFIADHHRGHAVLRVFPLMFYPGTPLYQRARADGRIGNRDEAAYDYMGTGGLELARHDYLAIWLRLILSLRNVGVPPKAAHRLIDFATHPGVRAVLDRRWFGPAVFVCYRITRKFWRNFIYQPFVKPWKYLARLRQRPPRSRCATSALRRQAA